MNIEILGGVIFVVLGGIFFTIEIFKRVNCKDSTIGIVIDIVKSESRDADGRTSTTLHPFFE